MKASTTAGATLLAPISWGTTYVVITELLPPGRPLLVAAMRVVPAGLALTALTALAALHSRRARQVRVGTGAGEWGRSAVLALFNFGLFFPLLVVAVYRLPGGVAAAVGGLQPLLVATVARVVDGRRPRAREVAVGVAAAVGVALVVIRPGAGLDAVGVLAAAGANVSFAIGVVLTKRFPAPVDRIAATGRQLLLGGVLLVPLAAVVEGMPPAPTLRSAAGFAYLGLGATALAFVLWFDGVRRLPTAAPPLLGLAAPVTGAVLGWALLGQSLSPVQLSGFTLTLGAIAYGATLGTPAPVPTPASPPGAGSLGGKRGRRRWRPSSSRMAASAALTAARWERKRGSSSVGSAMGPGRASASCESWRTHRRPDDAARRTEPTSKPLVGPAPSRHAERRPWLGDPHTGRTGQP